MNQESQVLQSRIIEELAELKELFERTGSTATIELKYDEDYPGGYWSYLDRIKAKRETLINITIKHK